jgi:hypothetical protein
MTRKTLDIGEVVDLSDGYEGMSRRHFLRSLGTLAAGSVGLSKFVEHVTGKKPDGKPLVHTRGRNGEPRRVRIVPQKRHSIITRYQNMSMRTLERRNPGLSSVSLSQRSDRENDLAFQFTFDKSEQSHRGARRTAPRRFGGAPVEAAVERPEAAHEAIDVPDGGGTDNGGTNNDGTGDSTSDGSDDSDDRPPYYDTVGGDTLVVGTSDSYVGAGTALGTFYKSGTPVVLTNEHVGNVSSGNYYLWRGDVNIGFNVGYDKPTDTAAFMLRDRDYGAPRLMHDPLNDVTEAWTFAGITDYMEYAGHMPVEYYGKTSSYASDGVAFTRRNSWWNNARTDYEVGMENRLTDDGDSGGPWVHQFTDALVAQHNGWVERYPWDDAHSVGTAAWECLDAVNTGLWE